MKVYYLSEYRKKRSDKIKPEHVKTFELLCELAISNIKEGEKPWWFTDQDRIQYAHLIKDKPWLKASVH